MARASMQPDTGLMDYLAMIVYGRTCETRGEIPVRWMCLRDDLRRKYLRMAKDAYTSWVLEERSAEENRANL